MFPHVDADQLDTSTASSVPTTTSRNTTATAMLATTTVSAFAENDSDPDGIPDTPVSTPPGN